MPLTLRPLLLQTFNTNQPVSPTRGIIPVPPKATGKLSTRGSRCSLLFLFLLAIPAPVPSLGSHSYTGEGKNRPTFPGAALCLRGNTGDESGCEAGTPQPPSSSTYGAWVAVPTQLRRAPGRQHVLVGLSCPICGSGAVMGQNSGSGGHRMV